MDKYGTDQDPSCYPNSTVLINHLDITEQQRLNTAETAIVAASSQTIEWSPPPYTLNSWQNIHKALFEAIYPFAGQLRTIDISKGQTRFCNASFIELQGQKLFAQLEVENQLQGLPLNDFVSRLAHYYNELNVLHPFREGNGRSQRILFEQICTNANYCVNWQPVSTQTWLNANIAGYNGNLAPLSALLAQCVTR